jgi:hypothetical protein
MSGETSATADAPTTWLSGAIVTFTSKLVMPVLWLAILIGVPVWVYVTMGRISIRPEVQWIVWFALIATVPLTWLTVHLQLVGYSGGELVVANYWREARIPFENVAAVERVWWYRGRLVRIRFTRRTPFGSVVYYMPKWGVLRAMFSRPEEELRRIVAARDLSPDGEGF